jgi:hypothetical protein
MSKSNPSREPSDLQHLARVRALTGEVAAAISAIEHNDLRRLQVAIANQERICGELAVMKWTPSSQTKKSDGEVQAATFETREQIQTAYVTLAHLNRVYAGVVKRSKRSTELLAALYRSQGSGYGNEPSRSEVFQTLSCEV